MEEKQQKKTGHELIHVAEKSATCTENGNEEYWTCKNCGKCFSDAEGKTEIELDYIQIPATGHNFVNGECEICGELDPDFQ